jgi:hypothetical protein
MTLGRIFKTPSDDAVEETLRSMHIANTVDLAYEKTVGWFRTILFCFITAFAVSAYEFHSDYNIWEHTADWAGNKISGWLSGWF